MVADKYGINHTIMHRHIVGKKYAGSKSSTTSRATSAVDRGPKVTATARATAKKAKKAVTEGTS